jgi:tetratricopeptide (TPR) repeat protein
MNFVVFIGALLLTFLEAAPWLAERFSMPFLEVYFPNLNFPKPPLSYTLAHHYRDQGRLEDAAEQYQKIIRYYPREEAAYLELLKVAEQMEDRKLGDRYAEMYQRRFRQDAAVLSM